MAQRTIADFERAARTPFERTLSDLRKALEAAGVVFVPGSKDCGEGVRFKKMRNPRRR